MQNYLLITKGKILPASFIKSSSAQVSGKFVFKSYISSCKDKCYSKDILLILVLGKNLRGLRSYIGKKWFVPFCSLFLK